jgi:uncharacterized membrane protein YqjE
MPHTQTTEPNTTTLVSDIINDAMQLVQQQLKMFAAEARDDLRKALSAAYPTLFGFVLTAFGVLLLCIAVALLLNWAFPTFPLWASFGVVGGLLAMGGGLICYGGKKQFETTNPLPERSTQALQENVKWLTNQK